MRLPAWLDPWWQMDFAIETSLGEDEIRTLLTLNAGRLRGRPSKEGGLDVVRRGGFMNQFVRAHVEMVAGGGDTVVAVHMTRPPATAWFLALSLPFLWLGVISQLVYVGIRGGASGAVGWLPFLVIVPLMWAAVIGANYTSAKSEARDLRRLITEGIGQGAPEIRSGASGA